VVYIEPQGLILTCQGSMSAEKKIGCPRELLRQKRIEQIGNHWHRGSLRLNMTNLTPYMENLLYQSILSIKIIVIHIF